MKSWWPTNKWWAATITTAGTVALMFWTAGGVDTDDKKVLLVGLVVSRLVAYVTGNEPGTQPGTVRDGRGRFRRRDQA